MNNSPVLVLLAGGKSTRMGFPKGLLDYNGKLWILEQISRYKTIKNPKVIIGLGYDNKLYFDEISWFKKALDDFYLYDGVEVKIIINQNPQLGAFSTLKTALQFVNPKATILVQPVDVPIADFKSLISIIAVNNNVVIPKCEGNNGHPVKLSPKFWTTLLLVDSSSKNARLDVQIKNYKDSSITYVNVLDNSVYQNINTIVDWNDYLE